MAPEETKPGVAFDTLPDECRTLENAKERMDKMIKGYTKPTLMYVVSEYPRFPVVEGFVVYTSGSLDSEAKFVGFQMKSSDRKPRKVIDKNVFSEGAVLVRGHSLAKNPRDPRDGWKYMTSKEVRGFLGNSLLLAMPREWLQDP
jgi:hypothetical protein